MNVSNLWYFSTECQSGHCPDRFDNIQGVRLWVRARVYCMCITSVTVSVKTSHCWSMWVKQTEKWTINDMYKNINSVYLSQEGEGDS